MGSADRFTDSRWERPLLAVSGTALTSAGALVFSLEGQFIGAAVVPQNGTFAIAGAAELLSVSGELASQRSVEPRDFGMRVQAITEPLARILNAPQGLVVVSVDPEGSSSGVLEPLDVLTALENMPLHRPEDLLLRLARTNRDSWQLRGFRNGAPHEWTLSVNGQAAAPKARDSEFALERVAGTGTLVRKTPDDAYAVRAGLRAGDIVVRAGNIIAPTPAQLTPLLRGERDTDLVLIVRRDGVDHLITLTTVLNDR